MCLFDSLIYGCFVRYLVELESQPDIWYRYNLNKYLENAVEKVAHFMGVEPADTFLLQNVTKGIL